VTISDKLMHLAANEIKDPDWAQTRQRRIITEDARGNGRNHTSKKVCQRCMGAISLLFLRGDSNICGSLVSLLADGRAPRRRRPDFRKLA
jgi:hypothetical protein